MKKVMLTKAEVEALESAVRNSDDDKQSIVAWKVTDLFTHDEEPLNRMPLETIIKALYVGYEIEQSPEDLARDFYNSVVIHGNGHIIRHTLNLLNIKISGINC
jgi:hypothetical protein